MSNKGKNFYEKHMVLPEEVTNTTSFKTLKVIATWVGIILFIGFILDKVLNVV